MRLVEARAAPGAVPAALRAVMRTVSAGRTLTALGVAAANASANHAPTWTTSAAVQAAPMVPDVRPALNRLKSIRQRQMVSVRLRNQ